MNYLHPSNVNELSTIATETGAEVLHGPLRYPSGTGGWQVGDLGLSEHLSRHRATTGKAEPERVVCGIRALALKHTLSIPNQKRLARRENK
jgi:hypothetical protein